jgi:hypothetical protein
MRTCPSHPYWLSMSVHLDPVHRRRISRLLSCDAVSMHHATTLPISNPFNSVSTTLHYPIPRSPPLSDPLQSPPPLQTPSAQSSPIHHTCDLISHGCSQTLSSRENGGRHSLQEHYLNPLERNQKGSTCATLRTDVPCAVFSSKGGSGWQR